MNKTLTDSRVSALLVCVCFVAYTLICFSRSAYTSAIAGIIEDGIFSKTAAGAINSSFYVTYSLAQIWGSFYVDRISPFKIIGWGLIGTIVANVFMGLFPSFAVIITARSFSGAVQFGIWPALLKLLTEYIFPEHRRRALYIMPLGISAGSVLSLFIASIVLKIGGWQDLFTVTYVSLTVITVIFCITVKYCEKQAVIVSPKEKASGGKDEGKDEKSDIGNWKVIASSGAVFVFIIAFFRSMLDQGIGSWMPTVIMECYNLSSSFSSVLSAIVSCSNFAGVFWVILFYPRVFKNEVLSVGMFMLMSLPLLVAAMFIGKIPLVVVLILIIFINMFKQAMQQFLTVEIPKGYTKYNKAGMIAGQINVGACLGIMLAGTIYGYTADQFGWNVTIGLWALFVFLSVAAAFVAAPVWKRFLERQKTNPSVEKTR